MSTHPGPKEALPRQGTQFIFGKQALVLRPGKKRLRNLLIEGRCKAIN